MQRQSRLALPLQLPRIVRVLTFLVFAVVCSKASLASEVLIYRAKGACVGCAEAPGHLLKSMGVDYEYATPADIQSQTLAETHVWIQPGGDALKVVQVIDFAKLQLLRDFVQNGGVYLGLCAGAFFADTWVDNANTIPGLGLIPGETYDFLPDPKATILNVLWSTGSKQMYFQGGPAFRIKPEHKEVEILAQYENGAPAAIEFPYGKGRVILVGPHPEATPKWFKDDSLAVPENYDNDIAIQILKNALAK